ncbi:small nuclear ribonucleoprotein G-like [Chiloscyllium plagiosum]|nr:small nuclear ribonucleoprotein G-like [Chiloscyllium plagiosum]
MMNCGTDRVPRGLCRDHSVSQLCETNGGAGDKSFCCGSHEPLFSHSVKLNGGRHVQGILRGFDPFMNLVVDESVEMAPGGQQNNIGMVVIRGNSIIMLEALERV